MVATVSSLSIYPVKSTAGCALEQSEVQPRGLSDDRRWMVVQRDGTFITARDHRALLNVKARVDGSSLVLSKRDGEAITIADARTGEGTLTVRIWRDEVTARTVSEHADRWLREAINIDCRLVYMDDSCHRASNAQFSQPGDLVSFADGYPVLLIGDASLADLNARTSNHASMQRFRPNITVSGCAPFAEDTWQRLRIGQVVFDVAKLCDRCVLTTIDPDTGIADQRREPLRTLAQYRRNPNLGILFGVNLIPRHRGVIAIGDPVTVIN